MGVPYDKALLVYLDILGFRDLIRDAGNDELKVAKVLKILSTIKSQFSEGGRYVNEPGEKPRSVFKAVNFSDLTLRITKMEPNADLIDYLNWEILNLAGKQCDLACDGILLRGALTVADLYSNDDYVFGPALVKAYQLESESAVFPRIVLDNQVMRMAAEHATGRLWFDYIRRGEDGFFFVDYLKGACSDRGWAPDDNTPMVPDTLAMHKEVVERKLQEFKTKGEKIQQKGLWLALYHNTVVREMREREAAIDAERILKARAFDDLAPLAIDDELLKP
jgi:hypothetical protein